MHGIVRLLRKGVPAKWDMFSTRGIGGTKETGNRGLADLLLFKKECLGFVLGRLPYNSGFSEGSWLNDARVHLANYASLDAAPPNWTNTFSGAQLLYLEFCENLVYGTTFDACLKALIKNSMNVHGIETQAGISETLADIKAMSAADAQDAAPPPPTTRWPTAPPLLQLLPRHLRSKSSRRARVPMVTNAMTWL